ncbi:MAG: hypothetical protein PHX13_12500 [Thiovulaceae bacterium]|nr:hypothetical protein [Sulfurimonadaceae bacterium]
MSIHSDVIDYWGEGYVFEELCTDELEEISDRLDSEIELRRSWLEDFNNCTGDAYDVFDSSEEIEDSIAQYEGFKVEIEDILSCRGF